MKAFVPFVVIAVLGTTSAAWSCMPAKLSLDRVKSNLRPQRIRQGSP
jgi:hypothetical protein